MDPETEARLAALLMEEAQRLRQRADKEGVGAYLAKPVVRVRPNPQFMRATVQGVQQANRVVEVNEMWRRRSVELDENYTKRVRRAEQALQEGHSRGRHADSGKHDRRFKYRHYSSKEQEERDARHESGLNCDPDEAQQQPGESDNESHQEEWKDDDVERFLNSRAKRGRGAIGCRMDEPGPYLAPQSASADIRLKEDWEDRVAGPALRAVSCAGQAEGPWDQRKQKRKYRDTRVTKVKDSSRVRHKRKKEGRREKNRESSKDSQKKKRKESTG